MAYSITQILWGKISKEELQESGLLSIAFCLIIGAYWMFRLIKDAAFMHLVGPQYLPAAKTTSLISLVILVLLYNKLVDCLKKEQLVYMACSFYGILFLLYGYLLHQSIIENPILPNWFNSALGWSMYIAIESLGSLLVVIFWSFVISNKDNAPASGHAIILTGGQIGALLGTFILKNQAINLGISMLSYIAAIVLLLVPLVIKMYVVKHAHTWADKEKNPQSKLTGVIEGLKLIFTNFYLVGILVLSTVYEIISFFFEYQMNSTAQKTFEDVDKVTAFLGAYGITTNAISLLLALFGTSFLIRKIGLTACLVLYPVCITGLIFYAWTTQTLWSFLITVVGIKALSYTINDPSKEILYIPTSRDIRFKAKSWIDVIGNKSAKTTGALIASFFGNASALLFYGSIISLGIISLWIPIAFFVGNKNAKLTATNQTIE